MDFEHIIPVENDKPDKKKGSGLIIVTGILAVILFLGGVSYFVGMNSSPSKPENLQPETLGTKTQETGQPLYKKRADTATESATPVPESEAKTPDSEVLGANIQTTTIRSNPSLDGYVAKDGTTNTQKGIQVGKEQTELIRGFVSFDLSGVPAQAKITKATLRIYQVKVDGESFAGNNSVVVDNLDFGGTLDADDYSLGAEHSGFAVLSGSANLGWKEVDVTEVFMENYEMGLTRSQYRLRQSNESKLVGESAEIISYESADNFSGTNHTPEVIIKYSK